jgi:hypothetical protein
VECTPKCDTENKGQFSIGEQDVQAQIVTPCFQPAFKLGIVNRMLAGEKVGALARELRFSSKDLYIWHDRFLPGGPEALRGPGRPGLPSLRMLFRNTRKSE